MISCYLLRLENFFKSLSVLNIPVVLIECEIQSLFTAGPVVMMSMYQRQLSCHLSQETSIHHNRYLIQSAYFIKRK